MRIEDFFDLKIYFGLKYLENIIGTLTNSLMASKKGPKTRNQSEIKNLLDFRGKKNT
jgi:hypothetical protein